MVCLVKQKGYTMHMQHIRLYNHTVASAYRTMLTHGIVSRYASIAHAVRVKLGV